MTLQLCTTDSSLRSQLGVAAGRFDVSGLGAFRSQPTPLPVMPANAFIFATKAMPASLNGERSRAFCFPHLLNPGTGSSSFPECVEHSPQRPVPALGQRPSTGYGHSSAFSDARTSYSRTCKELQVGTEPAILVHTSDNTIRSSSKCRQASAKVPGRRNDEIEPSRTASHNSRLCVIDSVACSTSYAGRPASYA
jgi:hypothetical protein